MGVSVTLFLHVSYLNPERASQLQSKEAYIPDNVCRYLEVLERGCAVVWDVLLSKMYLLTFCCVLCFGDSK
jgi:hypothetical protein